MNQPELTSEQVRFMSVALQAWGGSSYVNQALISMFGCESEDDFRSSIKRHEEQIRRGLSLTDTDWTRALFAVELIFVSDIFGAGVEWESVSPYTDEDSIEILRSIQRRTIRLIRYAALE